MPDSDEQFKMLVMGLEAKLGRLPTEDEVVAFIFGTEEERRKIWNGEFNG